MKNTFIALAVTALLVTVCVQAFIHDYTFYSDEKAFAAVLADLQGHYVLNRHKAIDYADTRDAHQEQFAQVQDEVDRYIAWLDTCYDFHDGHVYAVPLLHSDTIIREAREQLAGNDYGFATIQLDSGEIAAILVEPGSEARGWAFSRVRS